MMRGKPFQPGNKYGRGRPPGSRNKTSLGSHGIEKYAEILIGKCLQMAVEGNPTAMRLCIERLMPARRDRTVKFPMRKLKTVAEVDAASEAAVTAVARGQLTPAEGQTVSNMLELRRRVVETVDLNQRVQVLEEKHKANESDSRQKMQIRS